MISEKHLQELAARGINEETASRLGWASFGEMIGIPYFQAGEQVGMKYRTLSGEKKFFQEKGSAQIFYNWDALRETTDEPIIITEGELDCAVCLQLGHLAVSVPNGAPMAPVENGDKKYDYLADLPKNRTIILAVDNDSAGRNLMHDLSLRIGRSRCKWLKYPDGCKDINEVLVAHGEKATREIIQKSIWSKFDGIYLMSELPPLPDLQAFDCPVDGMGDLYKLRGGDMAVITGVPGFGKTTFVNEIAASCALRLKWNVAIASFEQSPQGDHKRSLRAFYNSKPPAKQTPEELAAADAWIDNKFTFITPSNDSDVDLEYVLSRCEAAIIRNQCKLIIIDPWNEMDHIYPQGMTLTQYTGFAIKQFKKLAAKYLVHLIVIAHPAKMLRSKDGTFPEPSLYDISDSAHWYNKPDIGMVVHRNEDRTMSVKVAKCRYVGVIGNIGSVSLQYDRDRNVLNKVL